MKSHRDEQGPAEKDDLPGHETENCRAVVLLVLLHEALLEERGLEILVEHPAQDGESVEEEQIHVLVPLPRLVFLEPGQPRKRRQVDVVVMFGVGVGVVVLVVVVMPATAAHPDQVEMPAHEPVEPVPSAPWSEPPMVPIMLDVEGDQDDAQGKEGKEENPLPRPPKGGHQQEDVGGARECVDGEGLPPQLPVTLLQPSRRRLESVELSLQRDRECVAGRKLELLRDFFRSPALNRCSFHLAVSSQVSVALLRFQRAVYIIANMISKEGCLKFNCGVEFGLRYFTK